MSRQNSPILPKKGLAVVCGENKKEVLRNKQHDWEKCRGNEKDPRDLPEGLHCKASIIRAGHQPHQLFQIGGAASPGDGPGAFYHRPGSGCTDGAAVY